jgi:hypothetical protein
MEDAVVIKLAEADFQAAIYSGYRVTNYAKQFGPQSHPAMNPAWSNDGKR